jgi:hypothetical protein
MTAAVKRAPPELALSPERARRLLQLREIVRESTLPPEERRRVAVADWFLRSTMGIELEHLKNTAYQPSSPGHPHEIHIKKYRPVASYSMESAILGYGSYDWEDE